MHREESVSRLVAPFFFQCSGKAVLYDSGSLILVHWEDCVSRQWLPFSFGASGRLCLEIVAPFSIQASVSVLRDSSSLFLYDSGYLLLSVHRESCASR